MQIITKTVVNAAGEPEIWLGDGSRPLTADELEAIRTVVEIAQKRHAWNQQAALADDLFPLLTTRWNGATQQFEVWQADGLRMVPDAELQALRTYVLNKRNRTGESQFTVGNQ